MVFSCNYSLQRPRFFLQRIVSVVEADSHFCKLPSQAVSLQKWQQLQGLHHTRNRGGLWLLGQLLLPSHYPSLQNKKKITGLNKPFSWPNCPGPTAAGSRCAPGWRTSSWAAVQAGKRLGQELTYDSDGEEVWPSF